VVRCGTTSLLRQEMQCCLGTFLIQPSRCCSLSHAKDCSAISPVHLYWTANDRASYIVHTPPILVNHTPSYLPSIFVCEEAFLCSTLARSTFPNSPHSPRITVLSLMNPDPLRLRFVARQRSELQCRPGPHIRIHRLDHIF
jgi:hypothetical protein